MFRTVFPILCAVILVVSGCKEDGIITDPPGPPAPAEGFPEAVGSIMAAKCVDCHGAASPAAGLRLDTWDEMIKGSDFGEAVIPFDVNNSYLMEMVTKLVPISHPAEVLAAMTDGVVHEDDTLQAAEVDTLASWIRDGARNSAGVVPYEGSDHRVIACAQTGEVVSIIDAEAMVVIRNISIEDLGFAPGSKPHHAAAAPDKQSFYVSLIGGNKVLKFDSSYNMIAESPDIAIPALLAVNPVSNELYVSRFMDFTNVLQSVFSLDRTTMTAAPGEIPVLYDIPHSIAVSHSGDYAFTASLSESQLMVINTQTSSADYFLSLGSGKGPLQIAVSPNDQELYISCQISNQMMIVDISDPTNPVLEDSIAVAAMPWHPVFSPDGTRLYVGNNGADAVTVINTMTRTIETTITGNGLAQPHGIAISDPEPYLFVSSRNVNGSYTPRHDFGTNANSGTVVVINTTNNEIVKVLEIEDFGSGLAYWGP